MRVNWQEILILDQITFKSPVQQALSDSVKTFGA